MEEYFDHYNYFFWNGNFIFKFCPKCGLSAPEKICKGCGETKVKRDKSELFKFKESFLNGY